MKWTTPVDIRRQIERLWERGVLFAILAGKESVFPMRLSLKKPKSNELAERFQAVRDWITGLDRGATHYRLEMRLVNHRTLGQNLIPSQVWVDTLHDAFALIGRQKDADRFAALVALTEKRQSDLLAWLRRKPLKAFELADRWERLLDIVEWQQTHPQSGLYLRQVDIPGIHTKFIENHRGVLAELFDCVLPVDLVNADAHGVSGFCRRYGFRDKPVRIRFRILDPDIYLPCGGEDQDITVSSEAFARLELPLDYVFVTENEINFLAFPPVAKGMVIFGAGYGFEMLANATWLHHVKIYYWGDIDTHGFAILDQFRLYFPATRSFLMDRSTLHAHELSRGHEARPENRNLTRLNTDENALYTDLCQNRITQNLRLEQERISYKWICSTLDNLVQNAGFSDENRSGNNTLTGGEL